MNRKSKKSRKSRKSRKSKKNYKIYTHKRNIYPKFLGAAPSDRRPLRATDISLGRFYDPTLEKFIEVPGINTTKKYNKKRDLIKKKQYYFRKLEELIDKMPKIPLSEHHIYESELQKLAEIISNIEEDIKQEL